MVGPIRAATAGLQLSHICLHFWQLAQMCQGFPQDRGRHRIVRGYQAVVHPAPLASRGDNARAAKISQVPRDFWLADFQDLHKIADANFLAGNQVEETQSGAIGQGAKKQIEGEAFFLSGHAHIIYGLTDMFKEAYPHYIRMSVYILSSRGTHGNGIR